ncbi:DUF1127 domain-containing protein [Litoreibacter arenae]|uniref:YjiS-like domain-containing protein n=1 Tax=Litoreibacter arenae DSM 19593 TaxID=1123360 RepID=S9RJF7_9RHOB|nr:DUF1127 domain-containing protein [Litoreibacter arenae]EPX78255.1 hypothetical protein thalar_02484 [Litoreibacter arenae DSM 19593]
MHPILFHCELLALRPMAIAANSSSTPRRGGPAKRWMRSAFESWQRRKTIAALRALNDHTLRDIGVHRSNIERFVDGLCGRDSRIETMPGEIVERHHGQSRLLLAA